MSEITKETILTWLPKERNVPMSDSDILSIMTTELQFESIDRGILVTKNGQELRDKNSLSPIPPQEVIKDYFLERKWMNESKANESTNEMPKTLSAFTKSWSEDHPGASTCSPEFDLAVAAHLKGNSDFDWHS